MPRIYLDNAATSWPKPEVVYETADRYQREIGAAAGRGAYQSAQQAQRLVSESRSACARLLGIPNSNYLAFSANGTAALNMAIHGLLNNGDHVVTTVCEHNSVLRPLAHHSATRHVDITYIDCDASGYVEPEDFANSITNKTRLVIVTHASNVTGAVQPIEAIIEIAHKAGALVLLDAAQTAGCLPIDVGKLGVDLIACGGHKGLLGPLGTGLLYVRPGLESQFQASIQGGTGTESQRDTQPSELPEKLESGNLNVPAIVGLGAAVSYLEQRSVEVIQKHHQELTAQLMDGLSQIAGVTLYGPRADEPRVGVVSCAIEGYDPQEFAIALDAAAGIDCRAGLHCAPRIHEALGSVENGGLVRFSPGWATTAADIDRTLAAIEAIVAHVPSTTNDRR